MSLSLPHDSRTTSTRRLLTNLQALRRMVRLELSAMVALSALTGYLFAGGVWSWQILLVLGGTLLLAWGSSALNQWQEADLDQRMLRTCMRPLPAAQFSETFVLLAALVQIIIGLTLLAQIPDYLPLLIGALAVIWYNAIYTPLKRRTAFAALPGAVCGALPPLIGWTAAGGALLTQPAIILAGTLFVWQIPHTWLLLCRYRDDLRRSGLPDLFHTIPTQRLLQINNCWIAALFLCYLLFPLFGFIAHLFATAILLAGLLMLLAGLINTRSGSTEEIALRRFHLVNLSMALLFTVLIVDRILN
ncbi:protoheme IX farnesyltransferase [Pelovirga terrestris]|uniref:Protoheme IX farnesyltransferase n=1 Tax=Pelovirga terrestris TaxID=2771352 RepID=A0A8J6UGW8_9BACT|nr:protoheme IX farnesyltransferase [Pelovirga terrestris]MBD1400513.1 protoheme IX farnesyltransferase [Pelovirga terrestris]